MISAFILSTPLLSSTHLLRYVAKRTVWKKFTRHSARLIPRCKSPSTPESPSPSGVLRRLPPTIAYILYMNHLFLQSPTGGTSLSTSFNEAIQLSLNFCYITPLLQPQTAPVLHPVLEGLFNLVVAWAVLLFGFTSEDNPPRRRSPSAALFFIATAFLTNIVYLPYLILREQPTNEAQSPSNAFQKLGESFYLPVFCVTVAFISALWALFARPEYGDLQTRIASFKDILFSDILAYSFGVDLIMFSLFQSWLVRDDAKRRQWKDDSIKRVAVNATAIPFFGLAYYLIQRARHTSYNKQKQMSRNKTE